VLIPHMINYALDEVNKGALISIKFLIENLRLNHVVLLMSSVVS